MHYLTLNKIILICFIFFLHLNTSIHAQAQSFVQLNKKPEFKIASGEQQHITLSFLIKEGYHIQADKVKDENLIPTVLSIEVTDQLIIGDPAFPQAVEFKMNEVEEALHVYSDVLEVKVPVKTVTPVEKGVFFIIKGKLHYQACTASNCYFPRDLHFSIKINIQ